MKNKINWGKFITLLVGTILLLLQFMFLPISKVFEIRASFGIFGWFAMTPFILGISLVFISSAIVSQKEDKE